MLMGTVVGLTFLFGFGNVLNLALRLDVPTWVAPLVAPAVDLSVLGLLLGIRQLALAVATPRQLRPARRLLFFASAVTLALNVADPIVAGEYGKAAFDAVGPLLLIGWAEVGPGLLRALTITRQPGDAMFDDAKPVQAAFADEPTAVRQAALGSSGEDTKPNSAPTDGRSSRTESTMVNDEAAPPVERPLLAGRYRVDGSLGRGGMSEVFHGYDERLDRRVAIKLLRPPSPGSVPVAPNSPEAVEILDTLNRDRKRFLREIRTTAQLEHPGTPAVYDTGVETAPDGSTQLWLVMQLLRGSTLEATLDHTDYTTSPPSLAWAAAIATQIAAVLADVHRVDIVHRDIKPANVMIVDGGLVKVLDFGIAILRGAGALPRLTQVDRTVGTPAYMSPEQWLGQAVTSASDIYSLGCLFYELLVGDVPFHATTDMPLRARHQLSAVPSVRARRTDIPVAVDTLVTSMLAKDAQRRPSAEAVYDALMPLASAPSDTSVEGENRDPTSPFRRPLLAPARRERLAGGRDKLTDTEFEQLTANVQVLLDNDRPAEAINLLEDGVERARHDPALTLRLRHYLAAALFYAGEYTRAASLFDVVGRDYREHLPFADPYVLDCAYHAGHAYAEIGKPDKALPQLRFYVLNAKTSADEDAVAKVLESRFVIAQMLGAAGHPDEALTELEAVRPLLAEAFGADSTQVRNVDKQIARLRSGWEHGSPQGRGQSDR
ncbi:serine/threonine protein kinase [Amycolatopsis mediterranei S699]|uniref:non-specific serine/threonine protein kinase n=1 Tax=Amycolatopsis mediterranei (strain S699) TaxID=713604 RepID=A0A9R0P6A5_AMYMS|nr:serine/threonine protein kinase [Amycolatopsis mediterranei S699]